MTGYLFIDDLINAPPGRKYRKRIKPPPPLPPPDLRQFSLPDTPPILCGLNLYIRPTYVVSVPEWSFSNKYTSQAFRDNQKNLRDNRHHGILSDKSTGKIRNAVNWLVQCAGEKRVYSKKDKKNFKFKVAFVTLTLPDTNTPISGKDLQQKLLNPFLTYFRKYSPLKNYVWKVEFQNNGKLHVHLTIDTFIHWKDIRDRWNKLLDKNGWLNDFARKHGHKDPNSTDVHSVYKVKDIAAYISKYMSKAICTKGDYNGRIWGCSYELSAANKTFMHVPISEAAEVMPTLFDKKIRYDKIIQCNVKKKKEVCIGEIFFTSKKNWDKDIKGLIKHTYNVTALKLTSPVKYFTIESLNSYQDDPEKLQIPDYT